jgi:hypothetical protein
MISMSFGFPRPLRRIRKEINNALHREKILFSAASNDGGNMTRAYPASQDGVICVHSADGLGNASLFNPSALRNADNFCVVGENIDAAWPSATPDELGGSKRMTGASFATPVAVAVAAFMIGFVGRRIPEHVDWGVPLKSPEGVKAIFEVLSERRNGHYDLVNPVRVFGSGTETEKQHMLWRIRSKLESPVV